MKIVDYVMEAAEELDAPVELWLFRDQFQYDPADQEWCFNGACGKGPKSLADAREWVTKICGWLQYRFPDGPSGTLEDCCR